jgi:hypothetical protein
VRQRASVALTRRCCMENVKSEVWARDAATCSAEARCRARPRRRHFISHSCAGSLWNRQVRFGPAMVLR